MPCPPRDIPVTIAHMRYSFGDLVLDTERFLLERGGEPQHVQPQVFDVLSHLVANRSRVVPKTELLDTIWGDRFVSESTLTSRIKAARRVVGDDGITQNVIKTVHGRGYRWVADVEELAEPSTASGPGTGSMPPQRKLEQRIRFCRTSDGERLAYATVGEGPPLVRAAHWITHLDYEWASPVWQHWMEGLSRQRTLVRYDERGCGLSDHDPYDVSLESFVHDLETVVDDLGLERFPLMGLSQGGPVAIEYAHRHPERVSRLILVGAFVKGRRARSFTPQHHREFEMQRELIRLGWGRDEHSFRLYFSSVFMPDADPQLWTRLRRAHAAHDLGRERPAALRRLPRHGRHAGGGGPGPADADPARPGRHADPLRAGGLARRAHQGQPARCHWTRRTTCCGRRAGVGRTSSSEVDAFLAEDESRSPREVHGRSTRSPRAPAPRRRRLSHRHR